MKGTIARSIAGAVEKLPELKELAGDLELGSTIERTRDASHGDFASNIAMRLAKPSRRAPRDLATDIVANLDLGEDIDHVEIAGPGFINFYLKPHAFHKEIGAVLELGEAYGRKPQRAGPRILLEYVSANPTGPLHVGHGRLAAYGATVSNLLEAAGYPVHREYYVNDAGRQMDILGASVFLRLLEGRGLEFDFPAAGYRGDYIRDIAKAYDGHVPEISSSALLDGIAPEGEDKAAKEAYVEALIARARELLGDAGFSALRQFSLESIRADIEEDLAEFGVVYDEWFSEQSLEKSGRIDAALAVLEERGVLYRKDGATWFPAIRFGDEKDRVVVRENGLKTYFASDIAYHFDKRERGYDHLIDILGADHHGYVARVQGGLEAMGYDGADLEVKLVQFVTLYRSGNKVQMSTRSGEFDTLRQLRKEVGNDAARFYYVMRSNDQHLEFDLDIATSQSSDNPVYYIQYAHARVVNVFGKLAERSLSWDAGNARATMDALSSPQEKSLMTALSRYPEIIELAAENRAPQHVVHYLRDLAADFHSWYNANKFIEDADDVRDARLALCAATRTVIANGLKILGVSAPEHM